MKEPISSYAQRIPRVEARRGAIAARDAEEAARQAVSQVTQRRAPNGSQWLYQLHCWMFFLLKVTPHSLHSAKLSLVSKSVKGLSQHAAEWLRPHEHGNSWIRRGRDGLALRTSGSRMKTVLIYQYILSIS